MILNNIEIKNYRCFEDLQLHFNKRMNVIVGNNGAGKSSILDAISIGIGSFLLGIESSSAPGINKYDARNITYVMGSSLEKHTQFPVTISCDGVIDKREIKWSRQLKSINGSTTYGDAYTIKDIESGNYKIIPIVDVVNGFEIVEVDNFIKEKIKNGRILENR